MDVSRIRALRGPNLWSRHTAVEAIVSCAEDERAIAQLPGFESRLRTRFPGIGAVPAGARRGDIALAHVLETNTNQIHIDPALGVRARLPIDRMLAFTAALRRIMPAPAVALFKRSTTMKLPVSRHRSYTS